MVLWSLTKNESNFFLNLSNQTILIAPTISPIKFNVLEVGRKKCQVKTRPVATRTKIHNLNSRIGHHSTLFTTLELKLFMRRDTIHSTTQTTRTLHKNTQKHYCNEHISTQPHLNYTHQNTNTQTQTHWKFYFEPSRLPMTNIFVQSFNFQMNITI